jgi:hypothetical protein
MKLFSIQSGEWTTDANVSEDVFETYQEQATEAISLGLEEWVRDEEGHEKHIGMFTVAWVKATGDTDDAYVMYNKHVFENIGRPDLADLFQEIPRD